MMNYKEEEIIIDMYRQSVGTWQERRKKSNMFDSLTFSMGYLRKKNPFYFVKCQHISKLYINSSVRKDDVVNSK